MAEHSIGDENYTPEVVAAEPPLDAEEPQVCMVPAECAGLRVDQALARMFPEHSRSRLTAWLRDGFIRIDTGPAKPKQRIWGGETVQLLAQVGPGETTAEPEDIPLHIVHEDAEVLVIDKPAGLVVHPGSGNWHGTLLNALLHHAPALAAIPRGGIVHRLDKDTSGLLVVAKTLPAQTSLVRQLHDRSVHREYLALVYGKVERDGEVDAPLGRDPGNRVRMAIIGSGKEARTHYRVLERFLGVTLLECKLDTGRTHQIRVHMQSIEHALVGDPVYRNRKLIRSGMPAQFARQALHAARLEFVHPATGQPARFEAPLPEDFRQLLQFLRQEARQDA